ncbi:hypothetical protein N7455_007531 [Penicillium solitum]|uniref:uncharacterized protein n=1 Tax=Penicillium solitum TaxID=60172 RepID=UPI0032C409B3|nr:hypothetical protein N7455_007531 [Penicillium solitum]
MEEEILLAKNPAVEHRNYHPPVPVEKTPNDQLGQRFWKLLKCENRNRYFTRRIIEDLGYSPSARGIDVHYVAAPTVALLCIIVSIAEVTGINSSSSNSRATTFANHARSLIQMAEKVPSNLEALRCHTLITIYFLHMDFLDLALQSIAVTVRLAMSLKLHHRLPSPREGSEGSDSYDQNLWWTIYVLDRNLACLGGVPYLIRDEEIDAPRPARDGQFERFSAVICISCWNEPDEQIGPMEKSFHQEASYLEALAHLGRIWACIWNNLATDRTEPDCQWQTTETLDAQLRILQQQLPAELVWESPSSLGRDLEMLQETAMQRQLVVLMRINTLRLFIRRNPASKCTCLDRKFPHDDGTAISGKIIEAIVDFSILHHEGLLPIGHAISTTLVQCILYLIKVIGESPDTSGTKSASASVVSAYQVLVDLSDRCVSARNAVETLDEALFRHGDEPARSTTATLPRGGSGSRSHLDGLEGTRPQGPHRTRRKRSTSASSEENTRGNDLFDCLQKSYESLDSLLPNTVPTL